ncbi:MAG: hypothetical protein AAGF85_05190 [Bacteroidota bacterium]
MIIQYKRKHINLHLFFGLSWLGLATVSIFIGDNIRWTDFGQFVISGAYISIYFYTLSRQYLTIKDGYIQENKLFGKRIKLAEVQYMKEFAGDYILRTDKAELTINTTLINSESHSRLRSELDKLDLKWA